MHTTWSPPGLPPTGWSTEREPSGPRSTTSCRSTWSTFWICRSKRPLGLLRWLRRRSIRTGSSMRPSGEEVPEIWWCEPGEEATMQVLMGSQDGFLTRRLRNYSDRNNPAKPRALSGLSPYLHFGQISAQWCVLEAKVSGALILSSCSRTTFYGIRGFYGPFSSNSLPIKVSLITTTENEGVSIIGSDKVHRKSSTDGTTTSTVAKVAPSLLRKRKRKDHHEEDEDDDMILK